MRNIAVVDQKPELALWAIVLQALKMAEAGFPFGTVKAEG